MYSKNKKKSRTVIVPVGFPFYPLYHFLDLARTPPLNQTIAPSKAARRSEERVWTYSFIRRNRQVVKNSHAGDLFIALGLFEPK